MAVQPVDPFPQIPAFQQPVNMFTHESTESHRFDGGSRQDSRGYRSTIMVSDRQQALHPAYDRSAEYSWQGANTTEASFSSARDPLHIGSQTTVGPEVRYLPHPSAAAQPAINHDSRHNSPFTTSNAVSYGGTAFLPAQTDTTPLPETSGPYRGHHMRLPPLQQVINPSPTTGFADSTRADQGHPLPRHGRTVYLPKLGEGRLLEKRAVGGQPPILIPGPTRPLGPPLKPLDGPRAEAIAQEQWNSLMLDNDRGR